MFFDSSARAPSEPASCKEVDSRLLVRSVSFTTSSRFCILSVFMSTSPICSAIRSFKVRDSFGKFKLGNSAFLRPRVQIRRSCAANKIEQGTYSSKHRRKEFLVLDALGKRDFFSGYAGRALFGIWRRVHLHLSAKLPNSVAM